MTNSADNTINREKKTNRIREVVDGQTDRWTDRWTDRHTIGLTHNTIARNRLKESSTVAMLLR